MSRTAQPLHSGPLDLASTKDLGSIKDLGSTSWPHRGGLVQEAEDLRDDAMRLRSDLDDLSLEAQRLRARNDQLQQEVFSLGRELAKAQDERTEADRLRSEFASRTADHERRMAGDERRIAELTGQIKATLGSTSWRATRPLRSIGTLLRRLRT